PPPRPPPTRKPPPPSAPPTPGKPDPANPTPRTPPREPHPPPSGAPPQRKGRPVAALTFGLAAPAPPEGAPLPSAASYLRRPLTSGCLLPAASVKILGPLVRRLLAVATLRHLIRPSLIRPVWLLVFPNSSLADAT